MIFNKDYLYMGKGSAQTFLPIVQVTGCYVPGATTTNFSKLTLLNNEIVYPIKCISYVFTNSTNSSYSTTLTVNGETVTTSTSPLVLNEEVTSTFDADITGSLNIYNITSRLANRSVYFSIPKSNREPDYIIYCAANSDTDSEGDYTASTYIYNNITKTNTKVPTSNTALIEPGNYFFAQMRNTNSSINVSIYLDNIRYYFTGTTSRNTSRTEEITLTTGNIRTNDVSSIKSGANIICLWKK